MLNGLTKRRRQAASGQIDDDLVAVDERSKRVRIAREDDETDKIVGTSLQLLPVSEQEVLQHTLHDLETLERSALKGHRRPHAGRPIDHQLDGDSLFRGLDSAGQRLWPRDRRREQGEHARTHQYWQPSQPRPDRGKTSEASRTGQHERRRDAEETKPDQQDGQADQRERPG